MPNSPRGITSSGGSTPAVFNPSAVVKATNLDEVMEGDEEEEEEENDTNVEEVQKEEEEENDANVEEVQKEEEEIDATGKEDEVQAEDKTIDETLDESNVSLNDNTIDESSNNVELSSSTKTVAKKKVIVSPKTRKEIEKEKLLQLSEALKSKITKNISKWKRNIIRVEIYRKV